MHAMCAGVEERGRADEAECMKSAGASWVVSAILVVGAAGCSVNPNECDNDLSCFAREQCIQRTCVLMASEPDQGEPDPVVDMGSDAGMQGCKTDAQCISKEQVCNVKLGLCEARPLGPLCDFESPCQVSSQICRAGSCEQGSCESELECGFGRTCAQGVCEQPDWEFMFTEVQSGEVPDALTMQRVDASMQELVYTSQLLSTQSNTSARLKAALDLFAGSDALQSYFELCDFEFTLQQEPGDDVWVNSETGTVRVESNHLVWKGDSSVLMQGDTIFFLQMKMSCEDDPEIPNDPAPLDEVSDESVISLDFSRFSEDIGRGYPIRIRFEP